MTRQPLAILSTGMITSVGNKAESTCAAIRAGISNPSLTKFVDDCGDWIMAHRTQLPASLRGRPRLVRMASAAIAECMSCVESKDWATIPMILCVAEKDRAGRLSGLDADLFGEIERDLGSKFAANSAILPFGRVGGAIALAHASKLVHESGCPQVLIAGADSLLEAATLAAYLSSGRLLTKENSDGFMPGEAASAVLVGPPPRGSQWICTGVGFGKELAAIESGEPLRGEGLSQAVRNALAAANLQMHDLHYRITDCSGEQYYFKEAALLISRILRHRIKTFPHWHPAHCIGEVGAACGPCVFALGSASVTKGYSEGDRLLCHFGTDAGLRASAIFEARGSTEER
jgi:3-oxoacyl-[acyl-carrier-protein] synthase-1